MSGLTASCCSRCRFWFAQPKGGKEPSVGAYLGWCRRYPPRVSDHMAALAIGTIRLGQQMDRDDMANALTVNDATIFPATYMADWCGEFDHAGEERGDV